MRIFIYSLKSSHHMANSTHNIRNIVLLGHSGSGKTSFAEAMLFEAGAIPRRGRVEDGNTVSDYTMIEQERGTSLFSSLIHVNWKNSKLNILDTPGYDDFISEVVSSLKVADTAVMLINAASGVEVGTEILWDYVQQFKTPCIFAVNHVDQDKADFDATVEQIQNRFGQKAILFQYPLKTGASFNTIIDALQMVAYQFNPQGGKPAKVAIPDGEMEKAKQLHQAIVEAAAENDEGLMDIFFENGTLTEEELRKGLNIALAHQQVYPVFCVSALKDMGSGRIMGFINDIAPSPAERPNMPLVGSGSLASDQNDKTTLFIYKTITEPNVGTVSYFKVCAGTLRTGDELVNHANSSAERFSHIYVANGKSREEINQLVAGDIGVAVKLKNTHTNNTLHDKSVNHHVQPISFPEPKIRVAVRPPSKNDLEKLSRALHAIQEEDPTLIVEQSTELKQTIIHGQGQLHLDIIKYRIEKVYDLKLDFDKPRIPYRETITRESNTDYRHKKQSGGAGQFAEVHLRLEPYHEGMPSPHGLTVRNTETDDLPWGGKLVFLWCIVGGSIDSRFSSAIKKGVMQKMVEGPLTGSPCRDIRVSIYDGKMHAVDSNDMAFQIAGSLGFKKAFQNAGPQLLEPIYDVEILCSNEVMGDIMGDLQTRRAVIMGMDSEDHYQKIMAKVPVAEMYQYASTLRSLSQGKAKFTLKTSEYQLVPPDIQNKLAAEYQAHADEEV